MFNWTRSKAYYEPLEAKPSIDNDLADSLEDVRGWQNKPSKRIKERLFDPLLFVNILLLSFLFYSLWKSPHDQDERNADLKKVSLYSPLLDRFDISLIETQSKAQHRNEALPIWRAPPSKEVDEAWERMVIENIFPITRDEIISLGGDPDTVVKLPEEYNIDGEQAYISKPAVFHNLHCLNYIRKSLNPDYYWPNGSYVNSPFHEPHLSHCIMILLEQLTCSPDPGIHLFHWQDQFDHPIHDSNIWRKCIDFEKFMSDHMKYSIQGFGEEEMRKPPGTKVEPMPEAVKKILKEWRQEFPGKDLS